jgi:tRNA A37 threonylcarbamoyladenosine biosynthesis protein TsaE
MYRLNSFEDLVEKGILNQISEYEYIVIEWPKREDKLDISNALKIEIKKISAEVREVEIK